MRRASAGLVVLFLASRTASLLATDEPARGGRDVSAYLDLVERYRRGEHDAAASELVQWDEQDVRRCVARLTDKQLRSSREAEPPPDAVRCGPRCAAAAILMHTELGVYFRKEGLLDRMDFHVTRAQLLASELAGPELGRFKRTWRLAVGYHLVGGGRIGEAEEWLLRALGESPGDTEVLLALVVAYTAATQGVKPPGSPLPASRYSGLTPYEASSRGEDRLRQVLKIDPANEEARLRRAWLRSVSEETVPRDDLVWLVEKSRDPSLRYLAHLLLGRMDEGAKREPEAAAHYRAAVDLEPSSQTARLALSHVLLAQGDVAAAIAEGRAALEPAGDAPPPDGWYRFWDEADRRYWQLVQQLRDEVAR